MQKSLWAEPPISPASEAVVPWFRRSLIRWKCSAQDHNISPRICSACFSSHLRSASAAVHDSASRPLCGKDPRCVRWRQAGLIRDVTRLVMTPIRVLNDTELQELSPGPCAPFALGGTKEIDREVRAAGNLYWASLLIRMAHLGETIIDGSPVVIIEPSICVRVRPHPDDDSNAVIRESLLERFGARQE